MVTTGKREPGFHPKILTVDLVRGVQPPAWLRRTWKYHASSTGKRKPGDGGRGTQTMYIA